MGQGYKKAILQAISINDLLKTNPQFLEVSFSGILPQTISFLLLIQPDILIHLLK